VSLRRRKRGTPRQRAKSIFHAAQYKRYADIVRIDFPESAKQSVKKLEEEFRSAKRRSKQLRILRVINESANRAKIMAQNIRLSIQQRDEAREVERIYRDAYKKLSRLYSKRWIGKR
jgi:hypothetical protein